MCASRVWNETIGKGRKVDELITGFTHFVSCLYAMWVAMEMGGKDEAAP